MNWTNCSVYEAESSTNLKESIADPTSWFDFRRGLLGTETGNEVGDAAHDTCYIETETPMRGGEQIERLTI